MFLVVARCLMDDVPLRLFDNKSQAKRFARTVARSTVIKTAIEVMHIAVSEVQNISVIHFSEGGTPVRCELVRPIDTALAPAPPLTQ